MEHGIQAPGIVGFIINDKLFNFGIGVQFVINFPQISAFNISVT